MALMLTDENAMRQQFAGTESMYELCVCCGRVFLILYKYWVSVSLRMSNKQGKTTVFVQSIVKFI